MFYKKAKSVYHSDWDLVLKKSRGAESCVFQQPRLTEDHLKLHNFTGRFIKADDYCWKSNNIDSAKIIAVYTVY